MTIVQRTDKLTKEGMYSADIHCESRLEGKFKVPFLDVRDGGLVEEEYEARYNKDEKGKPKKYKRLISNGVRREVEIMNRRSGKVSKYIPTKVKIDIK